MGTINQAVGKVVDWNGNHKWIRISRQKITTLARNYRNMPAFRYMKIYEIINYKKGGNHIIGNQIGWITQKGEKLNI